MSIRVKVDADMCGGFANCVMTAPSVFRNSTRRPSRPRLWQAIRLQARRMPPGCGGGLPGACHPHRERLTAILPGFMASGVIIVGASVAGVRVARELRQLDFARRIMLVERESGLPYDKPPLSKSRLSEPDACDEWLISRQELIDLEIDYLDRHHVTAVDVEAHRVRVATGTEYVLRTSRCGHWLHAPPSGAS